MTTPRAIPSAERRRLAASNRQTRASIARERRTARGADNPPSHRPVRDPLVRSLTGEWVSPCSADSGSGVDGGQLADTGRPADGGQPIGVAVAARIALTSKE